MLTKTQGPATQNPDSLGYQLRQGAVFLAVVGAAIGACWYFATPSTGTEPALGMPDFLSILAEHPFVGFTIVPLVAGLLLYSAITSQVRHSGNLLRRRFQSIGVLSGQTQGEIEAVVGAPNGISALPGGKTLCQWAAPGYHIGLVFAGGRCEGVSSEFAS